MRNNKTFRIIGIITAALAAGAGAVFLFLRRRAMKGIMFSLTAAVLMCGLLAAPMTAYAKTDPDAEREVDLGEILTPVVEPVTEPETEPTPPPDPVPLTPPGNLTLVDDISGEQAEDKQFVTVVTKSGNYFYLVIDRAGDKENVHFLNLVDEADLMAIIEKDKKPEPTPPPAPPVVEPTTEPIPEPPKANNTGSIVIALLLLAGLGGGAFYYFKVLKPKNDAAKGAATTELDDFQFDDDEDEELYFDSPPEPGDEDTDDVPDFTAAPDSEADSADDFSFDFGGEQPESEGKE